MELTEAAEGYRKHLHSLGRAEGTMRVRSIYLGKLGEHCRQVADITPAAMTEVFGRIPGDGAKTQAYYTYRGFLAWAADNGHLDQTAAKLALTGRTHSWPERKPMTYIGVEQFPVMLELAGERHPVERAWCAAALYTLCRESEIDGIRLGGVNLAEGSMQVWRDKRKRWTVCPISLELEEELAVWLPVYAGLMGYQDFRVMMSEHPDWHLIPRRIFEVVQPVAGNITGHAIVGVNPDRPYGRAEALVKRVLAGLGATETASGRSVPYLGQGAHLIRRSGARALYLILCADPSIGGDRGLLQVGAMLDHRSREETAKYIGVDLERDAIHERARTRGLYGSQAKITGGNVIPFRRSAAGA